MVSTPFVAVPPARYGGTELVVHALVEGLVERGHEVTLYATGDSRTSGSLRARLPGPVWPPHPMVDLDHVAWALAEIAAGGGYDVLHVHSAVALPFAPFLARPLVYTLHHARDESLSRFYRSFPQPLYVAISERQRRLETPLPASVTIHHGLDPDRYPFGVGGDDLVFIGRFSPVKGLHDAIRAARGARCRLRVAGAVHPTDAEYWRDAVLPLLGPDIAMEGEADHRLKLEMLRSARALLFPIDWEEPFGLIAIEAMFCGTPVVSYRRGSMPEVIDEGITGFFVRDADEMADLCAGRVLDRFDRRRCRRQAILRFNHRRMAGDYLHAYGLAVREHRRAHGGPPVRTAADELAGGLALGLEAE